MELATIDEAVEEPRPVAVQERDREFNCLVFVERALRSQRESGYLSSDAYNKDPNGAVNDTAEAEDEEVD